MASEWYFQLDGQIGGPVSDRGLRTMALTGEIRPSDLVRCGLDGKWNPASTVKGLEFNQPSMTFPTEADFQEPRKEVPKVQTYKYKMVQIPQIIQTPSKEAHKAASDYLESAVNREAANGWEFFRIDEIGVREIVGCVAALLMAIGGWPPPIRRYYVITFRKSSLANMV